MAKISLERALTSAAYGLIDVGMQELDVGQGWTETFKNATDISRTAVSLGSLAVNYAGLETEFSEVLFYSSLPKFEESLYNAAKKTVMKKEVARTPPRTPSQTRMPPRPAAPAILSY